MKFQLHHGHNIEGRDGDAVGVFGAAAAIADRRHGGQDKSVFQERLHRGCDTHVRAHRISLTVDVILIIVIVLWLGVFNRSFRQGQDCLLNSLR